MIGQGEEQRPDRAQARAAAEQQNRRTVSERKYAVHLQQLRRIKTGAAAWNTACHAVTTAGT